MWAIRSGRSPKMSDVSESLRWLTKNEPPWAICSGSSEEISNREWIAQVAHQKWANERIASFFRESLICSFLGKKRAIRSKNWWANSQHCIFSVPPKLILPGDSIPFTTVPAFSLPGCSYPFLSWQFLSFPVTAVPAVSRHGSYCSFPSRQFLPFPFSSVYVLSLHIYIVPAHSLHGSSCLFPSRPFLPFPFMAVPVLSTLGSFCHFLSQKFLTFPFTVVPSPSTVLVPPLQFFLTLSKSDIGWNKTLDLGKTKYTDIWKY